MHGLTLHPSKLADDRADPAAEVARLEATLEARRAELAVLQEELRAFKAHYARTVGARLAELADIERAVREAEARMLGRDAADASEDDDDASDEDRNVRTASRQTFKASMRKLFWSVAQAFHPDRAADEGEARRRHSIMAEASRAYSEGDADSLHALLGDDALRSHCAGARDDGADLSARISILKEELLTIEFGLKRARQDALYRLKLRVEEEARHGRDALSAEAERVERLIVKARHRLEHLSA